LACEEATNPPPIISGHENTDIPSSTSALNRRAAERYPEQFRAANQRYPAPVDY
jgi:hypothetical protein